MQLETTEALYEKIKDLNELIWENRATRPSVNRWLDNFSGDCVSKQAERVHALYLLSKFLYLGQVEVREMLRAMFQDLIRHPLSVKARAALTDKNDFDNVFQGFLDELSSTRFLGLGRPAESGAHILYDFRLVNELQLDYFSSPHELFTSGLNDPDTEWTYPQVKRLIFIDDFCGTGDQAADIGLKYVPLMRDIAEKSNIQLEVWYLTLLATKAGLDKLRSRQVFDRVESVSELDSTYRVFSPDSQVYANPPDDLKQCDAETIIRHYGESIFAGHPFGYGNSQLLLGFHHNVPDNTLPVIWLEQPEIPWHAIFPRYTKY